MESRSVSNNNNYNNNNNNIQPIQVPDIPVDELKHITDSFGTKALIGEGSYGRVYRGLLRTGHLAAIKKLDSSKQPQHEFLAQVWFGLVCFVLFLRWLVVWFVCSSITMCFIRHHHCSATSIHHYS